MSLRISTSQFYAINSTDIAQKTSEINDQIGYISSGKRVLTAKDDAVQADKLFGLKEELRSIERYTGNITQVQNRVSVEENAFASLNDLLTQAKTLLVKGNNGALSDSDVAAIGDEMENIQQMVIDISNSRDENGNYVFAGYQTDQKPFILQPDNSVTYNGDSGVRSMQIAGSVFVDLNIPGDQAFQNVPNALGNFFPDHTANAGELIVDKAKIVDRGSYDETGTPPPYQFDFLAADHVQVRDDNGAVVFDSGAGGYSPGQTVQFNGVEVEISGTPVTGDQIIFDPVDEISVFDTLKQAIDWLQTPSPKPDGHQTDYNYILDQLNSAFTHNTVQRSDAGLRQSTADNQESLHLDAEISLEKARSQVEDLDFAKALAEFEQSQVSLQAAQQTFAKVQTLTLFNYI